MTAGRGASTIAAGLLSLLSLTCAGPPRDGRFLLALRLIEGNSGSAVPGLVRVLNARGEAVPLENLLSRGLGLEAKHVAHQWRVLPGAAVLRLPRENLTLEVFRGLDTEVVRVEIAGSAWGQEAEPYPCDVHLHRFYDAALRGWRGANTHLHLKEIGRADADRYLREVPAADGLDALYVSYLERAEADRTYVSNSYSADDLRRLSGQSGVQIGGGEEHRHNFGGFDEGYGHVMFLDLRTLVRPVSIGRGIMKEGNDAPPLRDGIDEARRQGATVLWCHNTFGLEDLPNWIEGRPHAQNIFDGDPDTHGSYRDTFYRYLNAGLRVPFSTGTDWFIYDFSRVYAALRDVKSPRDWLRALESGRTFITNGPFLEFEVEKKGPGETIALDRPGRVHVAGHGVGRVDFRRLELVRNGEVVGSAESRREEGHFRATLEAEVEIDGPCWLALRIPPPPVKEQPQADAPKTELGGPLFAHTSAIHVEVAGKKRFDEATARELLEEMKKAKETIAAKGLFADDHQRGHVLEVYTLAISTLEKRLAR